MNSPGAASDSESESNVISLVRNDCFNGKILFVQFSFYTNKFYGGLE